MSIGTKIHTWLNGRFVGNDEFGNRYFIARKESSDGVRKRWVLYNGYPEPSKIPAIWHIWLHYLSSETPVDVGAKVFKGNKKLWWEKAHQPNLSGTPAAYAPPGALSKSGERYEVESDYKAWRPN